MKVKWLLSLFAAAPFIAGMLALQSCGGEGGPIDDGGGGGGISAAFLALMSDTQKTANYIGSEACADAACHGGRNGEPIYTTWLETKHGERGVGCEKCHGPGGAHQADPSAGNIVSMPTVTGAVICAQCHGEKYDEWKESAHGEVLVENRNPCFNCHSGTGRVWYTENGIETLSPQSALDALFDEAQHPEGISTATCATCHNPHKVTGNLTGEGEEVQVRHKLTNADQTLIAPGALASGPTAYVYHDHQCGECHNGRGADGRDTKFATETTTGRPNMHDSNQLNMLLGVQNSACETNGAGVAAPPVVRSTAHATINGQCSHCHMGDARHSFAVSYDTGCQPCHTAADAASRTATLKNEIVTSLFALRTKMEDYAQSRGLAAYPSGRAGWDYGALIDLDTPIANIPTQLRRARHNYYFVVRDASLGVHNAAYARHMISVAMDNMNALMAPTSVSSTKKADFATMLKVIESDRQRAKQAEHGAL